MSLGVEAKEAKFISRAKITKPKLQQDSLIVRAHLIEG